MKTEMEMEIEEQGEQGDEQKQNKAVGVGSSPAANGGTICNGINGTRDRAVGAANHHLPLPLGIAVPVPVPVSSSSSAVTLVTPFPLLLSPSTPSSFCTVGGKQQQPMSGSPSPPRRKASAAHQMIGANGHIQADCLICSDRATGKHYGSFSCDGCKGFFRRTIRKKHNYMCRFSRNCVVDKNQRNSCRRCRFDKCLANGMRPEAVQLERDRIAATRRSSNQNNGQTDEQQQQLDRDKNDFSNCCSSLSAAADYQTEEKTLQRLMEAERVLSRQQQTKNGRPTKRETNGSRGGGGGGCGAQIKTATTGDVTDSMHHQLILLVEWAKQLEEFRRLPLRSQIALLRHFSAQHLVICAAFRSLTVGQLPNGDDAVWLANDRCVPRDAPKIPDVNRVVARILDHLTAPMRRLHLEEREFVALKAVAFFDPMAKDVEESAVEVDETRRRILAAFEHQVTRLSEFRGKMPLRLADLLLLLPPLMAIGRDLVEEAQLAKLFGLANVDELMAELLLPEDAETRSYSRLKTSVTSSIVQSNVTSPTPPSISPQQQFRPVFPQLSPLVSSSNIVSSTPTAQPHSTGQQSTNTTPTNAGSPQQEQNVLAAPMPIYSAPLVLHIGAAASQQQMTMHFGLSK